MEMKAMQKYTIELSEDQLRLIAQCLEDVSRFASGQWEMRYTIEEMVRVAAPKDHKKQIELRYEAEMHLKNAPSIGTYITHLRYPAGQWVA